MNNHLFDGVKYILIEKWDPIGVDPIHNKDVENEYDKYATDIANMLERGCSREELEKYIFESEIYIGVDPSKRRALSVANYLIALRT